MNGDWRGRRRKSACLRYRRDAELSDEWRRNPHLDVRSRVLLHLDWFSLFYTQAKMEARINGEIKKVLQQFKEACRTAIEYDEVAQPDPYTPPTPEEIAAAEDAVMEFDQ